MTRLSAGVLKEDGLHTGDLAITDEDGYLFIVSRKSDMIKSGAHRISPKEIEEAIAEHEDVLESAVVGVAPLTFSAWIYADDTAANHSALWVGDKDVQDEYWSLALRDAPDQDAIAYARTGAGGVLACTTAQWTVDTWHHIASTEGAGGNARGVNQPESQ